MKKCNHHKNVLENFISSTLEIFLFAFSFELNNNNNINKKQRFEYVAFFILKIFFQISGFLYIYSFFLIFLNLNHFNQILFERSFY